MPYEFHTNLKLRKQGTDDDDAATRKYVDDSVAGGVGGGHGIPVGGDAGEVLAKKTNTDYDVEWVAQTGGGAGDVTAQDLEDAIDDHDQDAGAHADIRTLISNLIISGGAGAAVWGQIAGLVADQPDLIAELKAAIQVHDHDPIAHGDIRTLISNLVITSGAGAAVWGQITGSLNDQADLKLALDALAAGGGGGLATVETDSSLTGDGSSATPLAVAEPYTAAERTKLAGIETGAEVNTVASVAGKTGAVTLDKDDVGLGNVDNTSDANKAISTATQAALDDKADDSDLMAHTANTSNPHSVTAAQVGLGNVDNTSDANKPISTATQTALDGKLDINGTADSAAKLATGRTITITPTSTAAATFDGSANITPGVSVTTAAGTAANTLPATAATALQSWLVTARNCLAWLTGRFDASGNATSALQADKLTTARTLTVDPTVTTTASFDGSANATAGVSVTTAAGTAANTLPAVAATALQTWLVTARNCLAWLTGRFDSSGNAATANSLTTARTITVDPTITTAASFQGTANVSAGVSVTTAAGTAANTLPAVAATALQTWLVTCRNCLAWLVARFDASGNANSALQADKLTTARTITITPTATAAGSFDGSANITPGVSVTTAAGTAANTLPAVAATALQTWLITCRNCLDWLVQRAGAIPTGGTTGQVLAKTSATDFATSWQDTAGAVNSTPNTIYTVTSNTTGHRIKTDITNTSIGSIRLEFKAWGHTAQYTQFDTDVECFVTAAGVTANSLQQLNKGRALRQAMVYVDTDNTWTIYIGGTTQYTRVDAFVTFLTNTTGATTATAYSAAALPNRVTGIAHRRAASGEEPTGSETFFLQVPSNRMYNVVLPTDMSKTVYVATGDGNDAFHAPSNQTRANSFRTFARALEAIPRNANVTIQVNKYTAALTGVGTTAIAAYASGTTYAVGNRCTSGGFVYERVVAGSGTTPTIAMTTPWKHVNIVTTSHGAYAAATAYAVGNTVEYDGLTYVCVAAATGQEPKTTDTFPIYWQVCGEYNPIVTESPSLTNLGGLTVTTGDVTVKLIFTSSLNIAQSKWFTTGVPMYIQGTFTANYMAGVYFAATLTANILTFSYVGAVRFSTTVIVRSYVTTVSVASITFTGALTILKTDAVSRVAITASYGTRLVLYGAVTLTGLEGANTGSGIRSDYCSEVITYGNCTITGFREQLLATLGGTIENNSTTYTLSKGAGNTTATVRAIQVDARSKFIKNKGTTIIRNDGIADSVNDSGVFFDYTVPQIVGLGVLIPNGSNLDNYLEPGLYRCSSAVNAATLINCPYQLSNFRLEVKIAGSVDQLVQTITGANGPSVGEEIWHRTRNVGAGGWGPWRPLIPTQVPASTSGYLLAASGTAGTFGTPVDTSAWQKSQVPAGTSGMLLVASGTTGTFGTPVANIITGTQSPNRVLSGPGDPAAAAAAPAFRAFDVRDLGDVQTTGNMVSTATSSSASLGSGWTQRVHSVVHMPSGSYNANNFTAHGDFLFYNLTSTVALTTNNWPTPSTGYNTANVSACLEVRQQGFNNSTCRQRVSFRGNSITYNEEFTRANSGGSWTPWIKGGSDTAHTDDPYAHLKVYEYMGGSIDYTPEIDKYNVMYRGNSMGVTYTFTWNNPTGTMTIGKEFVLKYIQQGSGVTHSFASYYTWPTWITKPTSGSFTAKFLVISATQCRCIG